MTGWFVGRKWIVSFFFLLVACGGLPDGPEEVVTGYIEALWQGDFETAYSYLSAKDRAAKSLELYKSENEAVAEIMKEIQEKTYEARVIDRDKESAMVKVAFTSVNYQRLFKDMIETYSDSGAVPDYEEIKARLIKMARNGDIQTEYYERQFLTVKDSVDWKIRFVRSYEPPKFIE